jgi:hypothetical protein
MMGFVSPYFEADVIEESFGHWEDSSVTCELLQRVSDPPSVIAFLIPLNYRLAKLSIVGGAIRTLNNSL